MALGDCCTAVRRRHTTTSHGAPCDSHVWAAHQRGTSGAQRAGPNMGTTLGVNKLHRQPQQPQMHASRDLIGQKMAPSRTVSVIDVCIHCMLQVYSVEVHYVSITH